MSDYKQGDVVWRHGTIGARRDPSSHAVVVIAVNNEERLTGEKFYTCALLSNKSSGRPGEIQIQDATGEGAFINLSQMMIAGDSTFRSVDGQGEAKIGKLSEVERAKMKTSLDALVAAEKAHFGKVVYSVTPSHDGLRGKPNRPYVLVGSLGKGSDVFFAVPVSSSPGQRGNGIPIQDLVSAGLVRDEGEVSHLRLAWSGTISSRTSSQTAGRLSEADGKNLYQQFVSFKKQLISGVVGGGVLEEKDPRAFPAGLGRPVGGIVGVDQGSLEASIREISTGGRS